MIGLYIGKSSVASGFGAAGSLVVVLVWVYYSAQIFLLGAEFTWVYAFRHGSRRGTQVAADRTVPGKGRLSAANEERFPVPAPRLPEEMLARTPWQAHASGKEILSAAAAMVGAGILGWVLGKLSDTSGRAKSPRRLR